MTMPILASAGRTAGFLSGKVVTEVMGSALAIVAVTALFGQWKAQGPIENASAPIYRPTLDPASGKIVDRLSPESAGAARIGRSAVATFVAAPTFVAAANLTPWAKATQRGETIARSHAIGAPAAEAARPILAEIVPLPPARPAPVKLAAAAVVVPPPPVEAPRQSRLERVASWLSPQRVIEGGSQALTSGRDAVYQAVSYGGSAISRIYP